MTGNWVKPKEDPLQTTISSVEKNSLDSIPIGTSVFNIQGLLPIPSVVQPPLYSLSDPPKPLPIKKKVSKEVSLLSSDGALSKTETDARSKVVKHDYHHKGLTSVSGRFGVQYEYLEAVCGCPLALCTSLSTASKCASAFTKIRADPVMKAEIDEGSKSSTSTYSNLETCTFFKPHFIFLHGTKE